MATPPIKLRQISLVGLLLAITCVVVLVLESIDFTRSALLTIVMVAIGAIGVFLILWFVPKAQTGNITFDSDDKRFSTENEARKSLAQLLGGMAFLATFYVTWSNFSVERDKAAIEEFTKAVEQISNPNAPVRIGGAYALERLSRSSPRDYRNVIYVLAEALRNGVQTNFDKRTTGFPGVVPRADEDIQVIFQILGRRAGLSTSHETALNLTSADLRGVYGRDGHFEWANFDDANLRTAYFNRTHLANASFINSTGTVLPVPDPALSSQNEAAIELANTQPPQPCAVPDALTSQLRSVSFPNADLTKALFDSARYEGASFSHAILVGASFKYTMLQRAKFIGANLTGADFSHAHLEGADFTGAIGLTSSQLSTAITDGCTRLH